jgi:hypothetical protein
MGSETRRRSKHILIRVSQDEHDLISAHAKQCDQTVPSFLRALGQGYTPTSTVDSQAVTQLAQLHGDLGRVGGLLKLWLTNDERKGFGQHLNLPDLIAELKSLRHDISEQVRVL